MMSSGGVRLVDAPLSGDMLGEQPWSNQAQRVGDGCNASVTDHTAEDLAT